MGWAVYVTDLFAAYAPASWILAGLVGAALSGFAFWLVAKGQYWIAQAKWARTFSSPGDGINPLDDNFVRKRIKINDFVSPAHALVHGKTFDRCELIGPSAVMFEQGSIVNPLFFDCNFICVKNNVKIHKAIKFEGCSLLACRLYKCDIFVPESEWHLIPPVPWLSRTPSEFGLPIPWENGMATPPAPTPATQTAAPAPKPASERFRHNPLPNL